MGSFLNIYIYIYIWQPLMIHGWVFGSWCPLRDLACFLFFIINNSVEINGLWSQKTKKPNTRKKNTFEDTSSSPNFLFFGTLTVCAALTSFQWKKTKTLWGYQKTKKQKNGGRGCVLKVFFLRVFVFCIFGQPGHAFTLPTWGAFKMFNWIKN